MRSAPWLALLAVLGATAALLALPMPGPAPDAAPVSPLALALASEFRPSGNDGLQCATCHYGFLRAFEVEALLSRTEPNATYDVALAPFASYELAVGWAAPRRAGDGLPEPFVEERTVQLPVGGGAVRVPLDLPWPAAVLVAEVRVPLERAPEQAAPVLDPLPAGLPHPRPPLSLALAGSTLGVSDLGSVPNRHAVAVAEAGAPLEGRWEAVLTALDPQDAGRTLHLAFRAASVGYEVRLDDGRATGTRGLAHRFRWELPGPGAPGAPERFHVGVVAFNDHPTERWTLPSGSDRAYYGGNVSARQALVAGQPNFDAADIEAAWAGKDAIILHEHAFDGVRTRVRNERGERLGSSVRADGHHARPGQPRVAAPQPCITPRELDRGGDPAPRPVLPLPRAHGIGAGPPDVPPPCRPEGVGARGRRLAAGVAHPGAGRRRPGRLRRDLPLPRRGGAAGVMAGRPRGAPGGRHQNAPGLKVLGCLPGFP